MANPTALSLLQTGFRLMKGEWINNIINRINGLVAGTLSGSYSATTLSVAGTLNQTPATVAAAGNSQSTATGITATQASVFVTTTTSAEGVRLPTPTAGDRVTIFSPLTLNVNVFPATGGTIGAAAQDAALVITAAKGAIFQALDSTHWRVISD